MPFDDWASHIADGVEAKSPSQLEYEIEEALQKAYRLGAAQLTDLRGDRDHLLTVVAEQRAELTGTLGEYFAPQECCYDTPADHYREMARRLVEDRDALKHRARNAEAELKALRGADAALPRSELERYMPIPADLLPCPFCGKHAVLTNVRQSGHSFTIGCVNEACWCPRTDYYDSQEAVTDLWNRRVEQAGAALHQHLDLVTSMWAIKAATYARAQVTPLYQNDEQPTGYEKGQIQNVAAVFRDGYLAACDALRELAGRDAISSAGVPDASDATKTEDAWTSDASDRLVGTSPTDSRPATQAEADLRKLFWLNHHCQTSALYGDDGEMQCNASHPNGENHAIGPLDFKRDDLHRLASAICSMLRYEHQRAELIESEVTRLRSRGQALHQQWRERGAALCPNRSEHDVATRDLRYMERVERPMGALLFACADALTAALRPDAPTT